MNLMREEETGNVFFNKLNNLSKRIDHFMSSDLNFFSFSGFISILLFLNHITKNTVLFGLLFAYGVVSIVSVIGDKRKSQKVINNSFMKVSTGVIYIFVILVYFTDSGIGVDELKAKFSDPISTLFILALINAIRGLLEFFRELKIDKNVINLNYQRNLDQTNNTAETNQIDNTEQSIKTNDVEQIAQSDNIEIILNVKIKP